jgi:hypothetical protein
MTYRSFKDRIWFAARKDRLQPGLIGYPISPVPFQRITELPLRSFANHGFDILDDDQRLR